MLRVIGFVVGAFVLARLLGHLPLVGGFYRSTGVFGVWIAALLLAWAGTSLATRLVERTRHQRRLRGLGAIDTPHAHGKRGALLLSSGSPKRAVGELEIAHQADPELGEWAYALGRARLGSGDPGGALDVLEPLIARDPEHAYGGAQLVVAEAATQTGSFERALDALKTFERNHGPSPESAYRRGVVHGKAGESDRARAALGEVSRLAREASGARAKGSTGWVAKAWLARLRS